MAAHHVDPRVAFPFNPCVNADCCTPKAANSVRAFIHGLFGFAGASLLLIGAMLYSDARVETKHLDELSSHGFNTTCHVYSVALHGVNCADHAPECCHFLQLEVSVDAWGHRNVTAYSNVREQECGGPLDIAPHSNTACFVRDPTFPAAVDDRTVVFADPPHSDGDAHRKAKSKLKTSTILLGVGGGLFALVWVLGPVLFFALMHEEPEPEPVKKVEPLAVADPSSPGFVSNETVIIGRMADAEVADEDKPKPAVHSSKLLRKTGSQLARRQSVAPPGGEELEHAPVAPLSRRRSRLGRELALERSAQRNAESLEYSP